MKIRKLVTIVEETREEMGRQLATPAKKAAAVAVISNPCAGKYHEDLQELVDMGAHLGPLLGKMAREALGISKEECESYGKGALVGIDGEVEHGHAIIHEKFGGPVRVETGGGKAIIPSTSKVGGPGVELDIPTVYKHASTVRTHYDSMAVSIPDGPRADEIAVILVVTNSGRPLARISGLKKEQIKGEDGLK